MVTGVMPIAKPVNGFTSGLPRGFQAWRGWRGRVRGGRATRDGWADGPGTRATFAIRLSAASLPMSRVGWGIVVKDGHRREASGLSSKPTTVRSSGILTPRRSAVRYTPAAVSSLTAKIDVG